MVSQANSIKHSFRQEWTPILLKLFQKIAEEETLPNSFHHPDTKTKDTIKREKLQANITDDHRYKYPQQNTSKLNSTTH